MSEKLFCTVFFFFLYVISSICHRYSDRNYDHCMTLQSHDLCKATNATKEQPIFQVFLYVKVSKDKEPHQSEQLGIEMAAPLVSCDLKRLFSGRKAVESA